MIEIGQTVGNYNVTARLGEGGMGAVYLVEHPVIGRQAALKAIHPEFAQSPEVVARFVTEAKAVNQIGHEHIVDITDFGTTPDGDFYFIMERLEGESLADRIAREAPFAPARALRIAGQIAQALQASHDHGVIHRDLKPDNIFLVTHGDDPDFVKVLDFGIAKLVGDHEPSPRQTRTGTVLGTPYYMAPEQCEGDVDIDHRVDIYAVGVLLFEMLTGKVPFGGRGYGEVMLKHMTRPAPAARSLVAGLPPALDAVLFRALAKDPARRFQSMTELGAALADPEAYANAGPLHGAHDDLSGRLRAAQPMSRSEATLRATVPERRSARSTLGEGMGEITDDVVPRTHHGRGLMLGALAAGLFVVFGPSWTSKTPVARVVAAAHALGRPASVRLNLGSDPDGATVSRADGTVLGVTPLSIEAPYGDAPAEFVFRKEGFASKSVAIVPNLPTPIFAVLEREDLADPPVRALPVLPAANAAAELRRGARAPRVHRHASLPVAARADDADEVLPPTAP